MSAGLVTALAALAAALAGTLAGWIHFTSLARVTDLLVAGRIQGVGLQLGRFVLLGVFLWICAQGGWVVLVAAAVGILAGRTLVLRRPG
ncbi:MAG: hypothetical protein RJQ10_02230 [Haliea sp.]|uniref:N-ATPase subunit AtpR n=1 Tax=Haliea sp. TaxID=1932666 RepID=UPI0032ED6AD6